MKLKKILCLVISAIIIASTFSFQVFATEKSTVDMDAKFAEDRVIVKLANNSYSSRMAEITDDSLGISCSEMRLLNPSKKTASKDAEVYSSADITDDQNNVFVLTLKETGKDAVKKALEILNNNPAVEIAEPDYIRETTVAPNDPDFYLQYALTTINATEAWNHSRGDKSVVVGIIDTGIEGTHPDLYDNLWVNPNPNEYGYVNDIHGYNFYEKTGGTPTDGNGHGTHVSGIVGAKGNNGVGVSGVNWNVSLAWLGVGIGSSSGISDAAVIEALNYANLHDILITNNSWGGYGYSEILEDAIRNYRGLFVAAAGNDTVNIDGYFSFYPAAYDLPNIISVASTDKNDQLSWFSNFGSESVDIAAPGSDIYSTYTGSSYKYDDGTSMATPYVSGVAALLKSEYPDLTTSQLKSAILNGADYLPQLDGKVATGGRLNAYGALQAAQSSIDVYFQNTSNWSNVYAYYWNDGGISPVQWPGDLMTKVSGNIYKVTIPYDCNKIIFNNNGNIQTANLNVPGNNHLYIPKSNTWIDYNPDDVVTVYYQNSSYWSTPKAYYWEDNGYFYPVNWPGTEMTHVKANIYKIDVPARCDRIIFSNNGSNQTADLTIPGDGKIYRSSTRTWDSYNPFKDNSITIYFTNNNNWSNVRAYLWDSVSSANNTWPGQFMTYVGRNDYGQSIYAITFDSNKYNSILFNGSGGQTVDIDIDVDANPGVKFDGMGYYLTGEKSDSKWEVASYPYL